MATKIQAIATYLPRIDLGPAANPDRFLNLVTQRTTLSNGVVKNVQEGEVETLIGLLAEGRPVHTGIAIYTPILRLDGSVEIKVRVDRRIITALNAPGALHGKLLNAENIGKKAEGLVQLWNVAHPDDPVS